MTDTAENILAQTDRQLFPDSGTSDKSFRQYAKTWHPDHNRHPDATRVFAHISEMYNRAKSRWKPISRVFKRLDGTSFQMEYIREVGSESCRAYVGKSSVGYLVSPTNADLSAHAAKHKWKYANTKMETEMKRFLPDLVRSIETTDGQFLVYRRKPSQILMSDLVAINGPTEGAHVAWMITRLLNISCFLEYNGISHGAISPEFLLVDLEDHCVSLTGPLLYSTQFGIRPIAAPKRTISVFPKLKIKETTASVHLDLHLIRQTGRELLGDPAGTRLIKQPNLRPEIAKWLMSPPADRAVDDMKSWEASLGPRKFMNFGKTAKELYEF